jgi:hypothetical protein
MSDAETFADLKFKAECCDIVLTNVADPAFVIHGPGELWQDAAGVLQFKVFTDPKTYQRLRTYNAAPGVIGQVIPDDAFFTLHAEHHTLPVWRAERVLPLARGGPHKGLACGDIDALLLTEQAFPHADGDFVTVRFKGKWRFPCNEGTQTTVRVAGGSRKMSSSLNVAIITSGDLRFELRQESDHTTATLELPAGGLTPATPYRIHESLRFVLGRQLSIVGIETTSGGQHISRLISPYGPRAEGRMGPPLRFSRIDEGGHVWRMFISYFQHVHAGAHPERHAISRHVGSAIESSAASLDAAVLALAVAVEGLAVHCFPSLAPVTAEFLAELVKVEAAASTLGLSGRTQDRLAGTIANMRQPRGSDLLRAFLATNHLPPQLFGSWRSLRNTLAHGGGDGGRKVEETVQLKNEVLFLLYSLVFAAIGYTGPRTDYTARNWPTSAWPVPQPPAAPQENTPPLLAT